MTKCKKKNCPNQVEEGKIYSKFHRSKIEDIVKGTLGIASTLAGIVFLKKNKK